MSTTIRISEETKQKTEKLKKGLSFDKYIRKLNEFVERENFDIETSVENIPKLVKDRSSAVIKILRALEKQYFIPIKSFSEKSLDMLAQENFESNTTEPLPEPEIKIEKETIEKIVHKVDENRKKDILSLIYEIKEKGENVQIRNDEKVAYSPFYFNQKIDLLIQKMNRL
ncbi:MAG: BfmA/BtgA family mobilization protein [Bacteroidota bacterium]